MLSITTIIESLLILSTFLLLEEAVVSFFISLAIFIFGQISVPSAIRAVLVLVNTVREGKNRLRRKKLPQLWWHRACWFLALKAATKLPLLFSTALLSLQLQRVKSLLSVPILQYPNLILKRQQSPLLSPPLQRLSKLLPKNPRTRSQI